MEELEKLEEAVNQPKKKLSEQRKELARVKAATQRMTAAAKAANRKGSTSSKSKSGSKSASSSSASQGKSSGSGSGQSGSGSGSSGSGGEGMEDLLSQLDKSVKDLEKSLKNAEQQIKINGKLSKESLGECNSIRSDLLSKFDELNASLCKMGAQKDAQLKLLAMSRKIGQCQGYLSNKESKSLAQCLKPGSGKKAGTGSVESRRDGMNEAFDQGDLTQLSGTKGHGPSQSTVESADDGSGVSSRRAAAAKRREFKKQMEFSRFI